MITEMSVEIKTIPQMSMVCVNKYNICVKQSTDTVSLILFANWPNTGIHALHSSWIAQCELIRDLLMHIGSHAMRCKFFNICLVGPNFGSGSGRHSWN